MKPRAIASLPLAVVALLAACSRGPMADLRHAQVTPGEGVGGIHLGMSIADFTSRYGSGGLSTLVGDEGIAVELRFHGPDLAFLFELGDDCRAALSKRGRAVASVAGLARGAAFFQEFPACAAVPLASVAIEDPGPATERALHVGSTRAELLGAYPQLMPATSAWLAGDSPDDGAFNKLVFDGLVAFTGARSAGTPNGALAPDAIVRRLVIVPRTLH